MRRSSTVTLRWGFGSFLSTDLMLRAWCGCVTPSACAVVAFGRALIEDLFVRSGLERMDLLSEQASVAFYESMPHKAATAQTLGVRSK
jgi:polyferredoxin